MGTSLARGFFSDIGGLMKLNFDYNAVSTPCYVVDKALLEENLRILSDVSRKAECHILLAQKAFSMFYFYPLIRQYLDGTTASGLYEARLGHDEMGGEVHIFSPAYREEDFDEILHLCDHIVFNSMNQWQRFSANALNAGKSCGIRINPQFSTQDHAIYDPCAQGSRLGVSRSALDIDKIERIGGLDSLVVKEPLDNLKGLEGLHFHTLCEQNSDDLESTLTAVEEKFGDILPKMKWLNMGGGHHITRHDYDRERLIRIVRNIQKKYGVQVYLEPGEAIALNAGFLVAEVIDIVESDGIVNLILDTSAACHMPDVIEMPYRPPVLNSGDAYQKEYTYRLAGPTCLAGDIIGDYSFDNQLKIGSRVVFGDMAIYSMVKNNTFNGMPLPRIYSAENGKLNLIREFGYDDFKNRLS